MSESAQIAARGREEALANSVPLADHLEMLAERDAEIEVLSKALGHTLDEREHADLDAEERKLWCDVIIAYTASSNSMSGGLAGVWADSAVEAFKKRYRQEGTK